MLVCGALAFDHIGELTPDDGAFLREGTFYAAAPGAGAAATGAAQPRLNLKLDALWQQLGGCALNVSYGLACQGLGARPLAAVGSDFSRSAFEQLERWRIDTEGLLSSDGPSARAFVFTDPASGAQLTTFYPMRTPDPKRPKDRAQILTHYREQLARSRASQVAVLPAEEAWQTLACEVFEKIELRLWNPGQFVEHLSEEGARRLWDWANLVVLNAHEWEVLQGKLSSPAGRALIISDGAAPVRIRCADPSMQIPDCPIPVEDGSPAADPTGCGDALLAGVLAHLSAADAPILRQLESAAALTAATTAGIQLAQQALRQRGAVGYPPPRKS